VDEWACFGCFCFFQRQLEQLQRLPRSKQRFVTEMLDTVLQQAGP